MPYTIDPPPPVRAVWPSCFDSPKTISGVIHTGGWRGAGWEGGLQVTSVMGCSLELSSDAIIQLVGIVAPDGGLRRVARVGTPWETGCLLCTRGGLRRRHLQDSRTK